MKQYLRLVHLPRHRRHRAVVRLAHRALHDDRGGEVVEYALVLGLIVVASISTIACVGGKVLAKWNSVDSAL